jgi:hypothetical protein
MSKVVFRVTLLLGLGSLSGCLNPVSATIGLGTMAASNSMGLAKASVISPAEQAKYAAMSCPELRQLAANYETASSVGPAPKKYGGAAPPGKQAIADAVISTRLDYLRSLVASRKC